MRQEARPMDMKKASPWEREEKAWALKERKLSPTKQRGHNGPRRPSMKMKNKRARNPGKGEDLGSDYTWVLQS